MVTSGVCLSRTRSGGYPTQPMTRNPVVSSKSLWPRRISIIYRDNNFAVVFGWTDHAGRNRCCQNIWETITISVCPADQRVWKKCNNHGQLFSVYNNRKRLATDRSTYNVYIRGCQIVVYSWASRPRPSNITIKQNICCMQQTLE